MFIQTRLGGSFVCAMALIVGLGQYANANPRIIQCYEKIVVPAEYTSKKVLIKPAERKYREVGNQVQLVEYPAVYREDLTLKTPKHILLRPVQCKNVPAHLLPENYVEQPAQHILRPK